MKLEQRRKNSKDEIKVFTALGTLIVTYIIRFLTGGLRVVKESEVIGLDNSLRGERAFEIQTP